jgi:hypothetical protein
VATGAEKLQAEVAAILIPLSLRSDASTGVRPATMGEERDIEKK